MQNQKYLLLLAIALFAACHQPKKETAATTPKLPDQTLVTENPVPPPANLPKSANPVPFSAPLKTKKSTSYQFSAEAKNVAAAEIAPNTTIPLTTVPKEELLEIKLESLQEIYRHLVKPAQTFTFSPQKDTVLVGAEGTRISIPANVFVSEETGKTVTGSVQVKLTEY